MPYDQITGVGYSNTDTSRAAAPDERAIPILRWRVLNAIRVWQGHFEDGLTCDDIASCLNLSPLSVRPRITELRNAGKVKDSGKRRALDSGKSGIVWEAVQ